MESKYFCNICGEEIKSSHILCTETCQCVIEKILLKCLEKRARLLHAKKIN